jgi:hypothetical protein
MLEFYDLGFTSISKKQRQSCRAKTLVARHIYVGISPPPTEIMFYSKAMLKQYVFSLGGKSEINNL